MEILNPGEIHVLKLILRDSDEKGWAKISKVVFQHLLKNIPKELIELKKTDSGYQVSLTKKGQDAILTLEYL